MSRLEELRKEALNVLENDDIFARSCEELDSYNGFLGDNRLYDMRYELDELHYGMKLSEFLERVDFSDFNLSDDFWYYDGYGKLCSASPYSKGKWYRNLYFDTDVLDELINYYGQIDLAWISGALDDIVSNILECEDEEQE